MQTPARLEKKQTTKKNDKFDVRKGPFLQLKKNQDKKGMEKKKEDHGAEKQRNVVKNKFVFLGKSRDFDFLKRGVSTTKKETTTSVVPLKYGDFKKSWHFPHKDTFHDGDD